MSRSHPFPVLVALPAFLAACQSHGGTAPGANQPDMTNNPFAARSPLPFQAPPFDKIRDADYAPAITEGMRQQLQEIEAIAGRTETPTFANTIEAMERSGELLTRAAKVFTAVTKANTSDTLQKIEAELAPKLAAHGDAIYLDARLFRRVKAVHDGGQAGLDAEQKFLVERRYRDFVRAGALLGEADQQRLRALNQEAAKLTTEFQQRLLAANAAGAITLDTASDLAGLSDAEVAAANENAKARKQDGKLTLTLQNTTQQPELAFLIERPVRQMLLEASLARGNHGGPTDTRDIVRRLAELRAQKAKLLGFACYADYVLDDQMAKTQAAATRLLTDMVPAATDKARGEIAKMQALIDQGGGGMRLTAWDWSFYAERVRKAEYDLDEAAIKPYFALERVLQDGVFFAARELYGLTFKERSDIPVYHPDVRVFDVFDQDGRQLALFYADYWKRDNKSGGAWMDSFVDQAGLLGFRPAVFNVCNFTRPPAGQPALLSFDDVTTMFHEFGHALHGMFSAVKYPSLSGTNVPRDFVEFPSQFNEHWATEPRVFANYAKHFQTGAPMPAEMVAKLKRQKTFNQGYATTEYLAAALLDLAWHALPSGAPQQDVLAFERAALARFRVDLPEVPPRYRTTYFAHIWSNDYAAGYYAYLWSEVLDDDAYQWFVENGGMTRQNGQRFREMILSRGHTSDPAAMYRAFRGRDPSVEPLLEERGLKPAKH
jgi:peptidyl-dipeptidase Dcp